MANSAENARPIAPEVLPPAPAAMTFDPAAAINGLAHRLPKPCLPKLDPGDPLYQTVQAAQQYMEQARALATRRAYASDWRHFALWCDRNGLASLLATPSTVALYLTSMANPGENHNP